MGAARQHQPTAIGCAPIPHFIIVYLLFAVVGVLQFIAFFAILFTKKWPRGLFDFTVQIQCWAANLAA